MKVSDIIVIDEMSKKNMDISACTDVLELNKDKKGGTIKMGVAKGLFERVIASYGTEDNKYACILFVVNMEQFNDLKKQLEAEDPDELPRQQ